MKIEKSIIRIEDVPWIQYFDGQININLTDIKIDPNAQYIVGSIKSYDDLAIVSYIAQIVRPHTLRMYLISPFIMGQRSDRPFAERASFGFKYIADQINYCQFDEVFILDAHSDVIPALINNCTSHSIEIALNQIDIDWKNVIMVSPDAGAYKKSKKIADTVGCMLIPAVKVRLEDGTPEVKIMGDVAGRDIVIIDDIYDGGRTFESLSIQLKQLDAKSVNLIISHGLFSRGVEVPDSIDLIYTTTSFRTAEELKHDKIKIIKI